MIQFHRVYEFLPPLLLALSPIFSLSLSPGLQPQQSPLEGEDRRLNTHVKHPHYLVPGMQSVLTALQFPVGETPIVFCIILSKCQSISSFSLWKAESSLQVISSRQFFKYRHFQHFKTENLLKLLQTGAFLSSLNDFQGKRIKYFPQ